MKRALRTFLIVGGIIAVLIGTLIAVFLSRVVDVLENFWGP